MRLRDSLRITVKLLKQVEAENPQRRFKNAEGEKVLITDVLSSMSKLSEWVDHELSSDELVKVVRCKQCRYYKKYRKKDAYKQATFYACSKDMQKRKPDFYCGDGEK